MVKNGKEKQAQCFQAEPQATSMDRGRTSFIYEKKRLKWNEEYYINFSNICSVHVFPVFKMCTFYF